MSHTCARARLPRGVGPYTAAIKKLEADIDAQLKELNTLIGVCARVASGGACPCVRA